MSAIFAIFMLGYIAESFLPWWSVAVVAFLIGTFLTTSGWKVFLVGFVGVGLMWLANAGFYHFRSGGILTERISAMLDLPWPLLLVLISGIIGGLVGGVAASAGFELRQALKK